MKKSDLWLIIAQIWLAAANIRSEIGVAFWVGVFFAIGSIGFALFEKEIRDEKSHSESDVAKPD